MELTSVEAQLVLLYSGEKDPRQLSERAREQGVAVEPAQVSVFLDRLVRAGFLPKVETRPATPPPSRPLLPTDALPPFREDLQVVPSKSSPGLVEVIDPAKGRSFTIYDFEASVARMLDGRRTAEEVVAIAGRIGIPVGLESLERFLRQMAAYGFLGPAGQPVSGAAGASGRPSRRPWTPDVRELFQGALRHFRAGKSKEALDYLEALLEIDPENDEARELRQRVEGEPAIEVDFADLHEEEKVSAAEAPSDDDLERLALPRSRRRPWLAGGAALAASIGLLWPVPTRLELPCQLEPVTLAVVTAPRDGELSSPLPAAGSRVEARQPLATLATDGLAARLAALRQRSSQELAERDRLRRQAKPRAAARLERARAARQRALDAALARQQRWRGASPSARQRRALAKADRQLRKAKAALGAVDRRYQAASHAAAIAALEAALEEERSEAGRLEPLIARSAVVAPVAGVFEPQAPFPTGTRLTEGERCGRILAPGVLRLSASPPEAARALDLEGALVRLPGGRQARLPGLAWGQGAASKSLEATVAGLGTDPRPVTATLELPAGLRPRLWHWLR